MAYSRRLFFFDQTTVRGDQQDDLFAVLGDAQPVCYTAGRGFLWIGDSSGIIHQFNRGFQTASFRAHSVAIRHAFQLRDHDFLLTIGIDDDSDEQLKVWNIAKWINKPTPFCTRCTGLTPAGHSSSPVTCLYAHETLQFIVFGHANGQLQLFKGDLTRERNCKRHLLHTFSSSVTGVGLDLQCGRPAASSDADNAGNVVVFATTDQCIMSFVLNGKRDLEVVSRTLLDRFGAGSDCSAMIKLTADSPQYAVARSDAIYFYNWDGRGPCLATDGNKLALSVFRQYLVIAKGQRPVDSGSLQSQSDPVSVTIHDQQNKFIAGEFLLPGFQTMFVEWDGIYVICRKNTLPESTHDRTLICLAEKSAQAKLEMLFSKKNFELAIDIAKCQDMSKEQLAQIHWRYADHLYRQKEFDEAIREYVKTVGILEVSFVIQRFLEGGHISQLAHYLEALNKAGLASSDHLVLLLNCYARLHDVNGLSQFVKEPINPQLNVTSALQMLRQFGFSKIALQLAGSCKRHADEVCILVEDLDDCQSALESISQFPFDEALRAISNYGHILIDRMPSETVQLLDKLCSHPDACQINVHHFLKIFINNRDGLMQFLERCIATSHQSVKVTGVVDALLELALYELSQLQSGRANSQLTVTHSKEHLSRLILGLIQDGKLPYDEKKALVLCHRRGFFDACVYLWEKQRLYDQLLKHYMDMNRPKDVLDVCQRFGSQMPKLWLISLRYFASKPDCPDELRTVISEIDQQNLATPMAVLQILSDTDEEHSCQVGTIRDYLLRHLEAEANYVTTLQQQVQELRTETMRNREVVRALNDQVKVFQQRKCALCHQSLEPPSVHFLCDHSYHALCFENYAYGDQQCPECAPKNKRLLAESVAVSSLDSHGLRPELVFDQLRAALHPGCVCSATDNYSLAKNVAGRIIMASCPDSPPLGDDARLPSPVSSSPIQTSASSTALKERCELRPHGSAETNLTDTLTPQVGAPLRSTSVSPPAIVQPKSTSLGYHSASTVGVNQSQPIVSLNPFDELAEGLRRETPPTVLPVGNSPSVDHGLGPSPRSLNPFDDD